MLKIQRFASQESILFVFSGRIETEDLAQLQVLIGDESNPIVFDLKEVNLVSREVVRFLAECEANGVTIRTCPAYIRDWIDRSEGF